MRWDYHQAWVRLTVYRSRLLITSLTPYRLTSPFHMVLVTNLPLYLNTTPSSWTHFQRWVVHFTLRPSYTGEEVVT